MKTSFGAAGLATALLFATGAVGQKPAKAIGTRKKVSMPADGRPHIDVVFVLDTTGSMWGLIEGAKAKIWSIANQMVSARPTPRLRIGLVAYRDRGDEYLTRRFDLSDDIDAVYENLQAFSAGGGNDTPESVNQALHEAVKDMTWSPGRDALKFIFLVGDAPPHMDYLDDVKYPAICQMAVKKDVIVNTIQCGGIAVTMPVWKEIAGLSEGSYVAIGQSGDMQVVSTPMDASLARLNREIGTTIVAYGNERERGAVMAKQAVAEAAPAPAAADRLAYNVATAKVVQGGGDLVKKRQAYIEAETKKAAAEGKGSAFDVEVARMLKEQAKRKKIALGTAP